MAPRGSTPNSQYTHELVWTHSNYKCPLCGRTGRGGEFIADGIDYPVCTRARNNCLNKINYHKLKPCDILGAALRCILKGTALYLQENICESIGAFLAPENAWVAPVVSWAPDMVFPQGSALRKDQMFEIANEFQVCVSIRGIRKAQAKRLRVDPQCKKLTMWGEAHNFAKAYARVIRFIDINRLRDGLPPIDETAIFSSVQGTTIEEPIDETAIFSSVQGTTIEEDAQQGQQQSR